MDELLTYTEGDGITAEGDSIPSGEVLSEGPVLIGPIDLPKVDELYSAQREDPDHDAGDSTSAGVSQDTQPDDRSVSESSGEDEPDLSDEGDEGDGSETQDESVQTGDGVVVATDSTTTPSNSDHDDPLDQTNASSDTVQAAEDGTTTTQKNNGGQSSQLDGITANDSDNAVSPSDAEPAEGSQVVESYERDESSDESVAGNDQYAEFVDNFWSPTQYTEHDTSARVVRTASVVVGGVLLAVAGIALVLPVFGVPDGTTLAGIPVTTEEDGPNAIKTLQNQLNQTSFSITNQRGEVVTKSGEELGLTVDEVNTTKGLNSWINRSGVWIQRLAGEVTLPVVISGGNTEKLADTAKQITLNIKEPEVTLTPTGAQSTPGVDGYETDAEMLVAGLKDTIANVSSQRGNWSSTPIEVVTQGRTMPPKISPVDVDAVTQEWNHILNTPITLTKALNEPVPAPTVDPSASGSASEGPSASSSASTRASERGVQRDKSAEDEGKERPSSGASTGDGASERSANPSASASNKTASLDELSIPTLGDITLVNHLASSNPLPLLAQADQSDQPEASTASPSSTTDAASKHEGDEGGDTVEEGEGESQAGEVNVQDEQTPRVTGQSDDDLQLSPEDKLAISRVVPDPTAEAGSRLKLQVSMDAIPESLQNYFAAHTVTKGLKAHIEGEQDPPSKASPTDESMHDASRVTGTVVVDSMEDGFVPDEEATLNALLAAAKGEGGTVNLIGLEDKVSSPESLGIKEPISTFTSYFPAGQSRVKNIHRIADLVDGVVVGPGQSFELNKHVGRRTRKNGFTDGGAIQEGQMVREVGGGVSQFATTFFNAAWFSGVLIPQHKAHSQYFSRYPAGREATLNYPGVNLEITNDTPYAILVDTSHTSNSVTVTFWSTKFWDVESERSKCLCVPHAAFPVTWTRTRTNPDGKSEKWTVTTYYQAPKPKKKDDD
ncbi:VanW family protein [Stomatohabitans albus]|uniref:VanW family protein n=1 Tax=Stomatohabitans albus TaxID=3110766 RepID=UPI00300C90C8